MKTVTLSMRKYFDKLSWGPWFMWYYGNWLEKKNEFHLRKIIYLLNVSLYIKKKFSNIYMQWM